MYYGNAYYGGYYGYDYYSSYINSNNSSVDTTSISTEILGYTPLLFYIFIEPKSE